MICARSRSDLFKWVMATLIIILFITGSAAFESTQLQWDTGISGTLKRGGVLSYMGYSVTATAYNEPVESDKNKNMPIDPVEAFVGLDISKNGTLINKVILGRGESYILPDGELRVTASGLPASSGKEWLYESYDPWSKIELSPRGRPRLELELNLDDEYVSAPNTEILARVIVKNPGSADILNVDLKVVTELPLIRGNLNFHYDRIQKGSQVSETIAFSTPTITELKKYDISANVTGYDIKDVLYKSILKKTIIIMPPPQEIPILRKSSNAKMYLKDYNMVSLSFKNTLNYELKNVSISDTFPDSFKQISNNTLNWIVDVPANGEWVFRYILKPIEADKDGILFPAAKAEFNIKNEYYMVQSNRPETIVYGPRIHLNKQTDVSEIDPGETLTVTIVAVNKGSTPSKVSITDTVPGDVTLLSGSTTHEEYLEANKEIRFSYVIKSDSNIPFILPAAVAEYFELGDRGAILIAKSQEPLISIRPPPAPEPTPGPAPVPTLEPEVEALLAPVNEPSEEVVPVGIEPPINGNGENEIPDHYYVPVVDGTEQPGIPDNAEQEPVKPAIDGNIILNVILGCDNIANTDTNNVIFQVCSLVNNVPFY